MERIRGMSLAACLVLLALLAGEVGVVAAAKAAAKTAQPGDKRVKDLLRMQARSSDGVISMDNKLFMKYAVHDEPRPYTIILFLDALQLHNRIPLASLKQEFGLAAKSFIKHHEKGGEAEGKVFFVSAEHSRAPDVFAILQVNQLPYLCALGPTLPRAESGAIALPESHVKSPGGPFNTYAEYVMDFVRERTGMDGGTIVRPRVQDEWWFIPSILFMVATAIFTAYKVVTSGILQDPRIWMLFGLVVYFFSVSGVMYGIIRGAPFAGRNQDGSPQYFAGGGTQFGAEGFIMGAMHMAFAGSLGAITYIVPQLPNPSIQRGFGVLAVGVFLLLMSMEFNLYSSKQGYGAHIFLPKWLTG